MIGHFPLAIERAPFLPLHQLALDDGLPLGQVFVSLLLIAAPHCPFQHQFLAVWPGGMPSPVTYARATASRFRPLPANSPHGDPQIAQFRKLDDGGVVHDCNLPSLSSCIVTWLKLPRPPLTVTLAAGGSAFFLLLLAPVQRQADDEKGQQCRGSVHT